MMTRGVRLRLFFSMLLIVHGLIHVLGFSRAFRRGVLEQLSWSVGLPWLLCALLFIAAGLLFLFRRQAWWWAALPALILS
ncbi:MAG TPA: hypothetical protein VGM23_07490, partial [Armatimonadota bacterium]